MAIFGEGPRSGSPSAAIGRRHPAFPHVIAVEAPDRRKFAGLFSGFVSVALLCAVFLHFGRHGLAEFGTLIPATPAFWLAFGAYYLATPLSEWLIYRRLWGLPITGLSALMRKQVSNELLLGYLGDAQFYAWARSRTEIVAAPFGAVKDVTILSALTGNIATLILLAGTWPMISGGAISASMHSVFISLTVVLLTSFVILLFRRKLFSLSHNKLNLIAAIHFARIFGMLGLAAIMWQSVLPTVPLAMWLVLATLRMFVSRLPFLPNKDAVFAALSFFVLGRNLAIVDLLTMIAGLIVLTHVCVGTVFSLLGLSETRYVR